ncbi:pectate lyase-like adhesive domain-containing protein [Vagococcus fluvialis]|uniref:pectate lyase-like adhesive domain-containing protein n=1 Tax=Vagococcus fluvialis TaxID=2738 RepID=UPI003B5B542B
MRYKTKYRINYKSVLTLVMLVITFVCTERIVQASEVDVSNWSEFTEAIANPDITQINVIESFANPSPSASVASATAGTLDRSLKIKGITKDGSKPYIDFGNTAARVAPGITLATNPTEKSILELEDIEFKGSESVSNANAPNASMIKSDDAAFNWKIKISGFSYNKGNTKRFVYGPTIEVIFDGLETIFDNDYGTSSATSTAGMASIGTDMSRLIEAYAVRVTNQTKLTVDTRDLFFYTKYNNATNLEEGPGFYVQKGSTFIGNNITVPIIASEGNYFKLYVEGNPDNPSDDSMASEAYIYGETKRRTDMGGVVAVKGTNAHFKVDNKSYLNVHSRWSVGILMQSQFGIFDVDNQSKLEVEQDSDNGYTLGAAMRFRWEGDMTFNIKGQSQLNIIKKDIDANGNPATANRAGAVRMYQTGNKINVTEGSQYYIESDSNETIIDFDGNDAQFNLLDENSRVVMKSKRSGGMSGSRAHIVAGPGTEFQVTAGGTGAAFGLAAGSILEFDNMLYYDFTQTNKRAVMGTANSTLHSINSDTSIWNTASRIDGNPDKAWTLVNFGASGGYMGTLGDTFTVKLLPDKLGQTFTTDPDVKSFLTKAPTRIRDLSRISGNNAKPIVDELRIPTNADRYIFGHVSVPEGVVDQRDAWTDEATVKVKVTKVNGDTYDLNNSYF